MRSGLDDVVNVSSVWTVVSLVPESCSPSSSYASSSSSLLLMSRAPSGRRFGMIKESGIAETGGLSFLSLVEFGFHSVGSRSCLKLCNSGGLHANAGREVEFIAGGSLVCSSRGDISKE